MDRFTHEQFIEKLRKNNSNFEVNFNVIGEYKNDHTKILLQDRYGVCWATPNNLYKGNKTTISSAIDKSKYFANKAKEVHGDKYDYSFVKYSGTESKVEIVCPIHGKFLQTPHTHLDGSGCRECGKVTQSNTKTKCNSFKLEKWVEAAEASKHFKSYKLYIVRLFDDVEDFIKIGITFTDTDKRLKTIPYNFEILKEWSLYNPDQVFDIESDFKSLYKEYKYIPNKKFGGSGECYNKDIITNEPILYDIGLSDLVSKILDHEYKKF